MPRLPVLVVNPQDQLALFDGKPTRGGKRKAAKRGRRSKRAKAPQKEECIAMPVARDSKGRFKKRRSKRKSKRKRKSNPAPAAPRRRRRRASTGNRYSRRRRRRRNPDKSMLRRAWDRSTEELLPRLGGKLAVSFMVKRFGTAWGPGIMGDNVDITSPYAGQGWSLWNYILGVGVAYGGGALVSYLFGQKRGQVFAQSAFDDMLQRLFYTEVLGRWKWGQEQFGFDPIPRGYQIDGRGNRWAKFDDTDYEQAMLGLTEATPLGALVEAGPLSEGRAAQIERREGAAMGHLTREPVDPYFGGGSNDPYAALQMFP